MGLFNALFGKKDQRPTERPVYASVWAAVQHFIHDPQWQVEILEEQEGWVKVRYNDTVGELFDDPENKWMQMRFRDPLTEAQKGSELEMYVGWTHHCSQHTLFRWDIDWDNREYFGDAFALFGEQFDPMECIWDSFNSASLLKQPSNKLTLRTYFDIYANENKREPHVAMSLWDWLSGPLAPNGTERNSLGWHEDSYWLGSALGSVKMEQWPYYVVLRFGATDYMPYMQQGPEMQLKLYKMHLQIQRWFPHVRNFVAMTPGRAETDGTHEFSMAFLVSSGTHADHLFDVCVREEYNALREYTEWFDFDFNPQTAPWFDHSVKKPQTGYVRDFKPRPVPSLTTVDFPPTRGHGGTR